MKHSLPLQLEHHAAARPDALALVEPSAAGHRREISWRGFRAAIGSLAQLFFRALPPSPTVLLIAGNRIEYLIAFHAALLADATIFPLSPQLGPAEWRDAARRSGACACIGEQAALDALADLLPARLAIDAVPLDGDDARSNACRHGQRGTGSLLLQSSGTTGLPKIVRRPLAALEAVGDNCRTAVGMREDDRMLAVIPVCHSYGVDHAVMAAALAGCTVELHRRFDVIPVRDALTRGQTTLFPAVPFIFEALANASDARTRAPALRHAFSAGVVLPRRIFDAFQESFEVPLGQIYGSTEFGSVTFNDPTIEPFDPMSVGRPLPGVSIRILDRDDPRMDASLAPGREGQIAVAAPSMLSEYLGHSDPPASGGHLLSGDLGTLDADGRLTITGRVKLLVDVGGHKVNPLEVESILNEHPAVRETLVLATPISQTVNRLRAVVVWKAAGDLESLRQFARERLAPFKVPRIFDEQTSLPKSATGKLLRNVVTG